MEALDEPDDLPPLCDSIFHFSVWAFLREVFYSLFFPISIIPVVVHYGMAGLHCRCYVPWRLDTFRQPYAIIPILNLLGQVVTFPWLVAMTWAGMGAAVEYYLLVVSFVIRGLVVGFKHGALPLSTQKRVVAGKQPLWSTEISAVYAATMKNVTFEVQCAMLRTGLDVRRETIQMRSPEGLIHTFRLYPFLVAATMAVWEKVNARVVYLKYSAAVATSMIAVLIVVRLVAGRPFLGDVPPTWYAWVLCCGAQFLCVWWIFVNYLFLKFGRIHYGRLRMYKALLNLMLTRSHSAFPDDRLQGFPVFQVRCAQPLRWTEACETVPTPDDDEGVTVDPQTWTLLPSPTNTIRWFHCWVLWHNMTPHIHHRLNFNMSAYLFLSVFGVASVFIHLFTDQPPSPEAMAMLLYYLVAALRSLIVVVYDAYVANVSVNTSVLGIYRTSVSLMLEGSSTLATVDAASEACAGTSPLGDASEPPTTATVMQNHIVGYLTTAQRARPITLFVFAVDVRFLRMFALFCVGNLALCAASMVGRSATLLQFTPWTMGVQ